MTHITQNTSKGQLVTFLFGQDAVAASQTDVQLPVVMNEASLVMDGYCVPFDFEVIGVSATSTVAGTVGTLSVGATINGTEDADSTLSFTTGLNNYKRVARGKVLGVAGDRIGCELTTTADWSATVTDLIVTIYALVYLDGI